MQLTVAIAIAYSYIIFLGELTSLNTFSRIVMRLQVLLLSALMAVHSGFAIGKTPLHFYYITYLPLNITPAVEFALKGINSRPDLLAGYELQYHASQGSEVRAATA